MGKKSGPPDAPDPQETYGAQNAANIGTGIANQIIGNVNQRTPFGNLTYKQSGTYKHVDPLTGKTFNLPTYTATQTLDPRQQKLFNKQTRAQTGLADLAGDQINRLGSILGRPMSAKGAPKVTEQEARMLSASADPNFRMIGAGPNLNEGIKASGDIKNKFAGAGNIRRGFADAGDITKTYGTDYASNVQRVEDALMSRMNPQLERDRAALESRLSNQGIKIGTEAYTRAMEDFGRNTNDARLGAILSAGQEQSRLAGLERDRAGFENSAQQQQYLQNLGRGEFANAAQQQQYGQNLGRAQFSNQAQEQQFNQNAARSAFQNATRQQEYDNDLSRFGFNNAARQQDFGNRLSRIGFNNQARQQEYQNDRMNRQDWLSEQYAARNQPINEIAALLGGGQVQMPQFVNGGGAQIPHTDYAGIVNQGYQNQLAQWQQQRQMNPFMGGLFGLGSALIGGL